MDILIFSIEDGRFGPARLPQIFHEAGLAVAALCPADNLLAHSGFLRAHHPLPPSRTIRVIARALAAAIRETSPQLIIPGDEQAVILLQAFAGGRCKAVIGHKARVIIAASLGDPAMFAASLLKSDTMALARSLGIAVPRGQTVASAEVAVHAAEAIGFPVYLKQSFSWAGVGVAECHDAPALRAAFAAARPRRPGLRTLARKMMGRDWYPTDAPMDVQSGIAGQCAMYCGLAWRGRLVGGFAGVKLEPVHGNGPSKIVKLMHDTVLEDVATRMTAALGFTGFLAFDFMIPHDGGDPLLIECNPRPVPVHHLGRHVGVDLAAALARMLDGEAPDAAPMPASRALEVVLFPHALDPALARHNRLSDVPGDDPGLIRHVGDPLPATRLAA
ncbi:hypothetical protein [Novosphingobium sp.]|uniref:ATP-binding protein n=1 Tax=Novosphingobium sp. TaxID=1874826 RepID=UPI00333FE5EC